ncbi:MAG: molybdopterin-dependent oxidoreductase [Halobacteriota archaeon]
MSDSSKSTDEPDISRRNFLKAAGGFTALSAGGVGVEELDVSNLWTDPEHYVGTDFETDTFNAEHTIHTTCGQCNTFCPIKVTVDDSSAENAQYTSLVRKLAGNPYSFLNTQPFSQVPYGSDPEAVATGTVEGTDDVDLSRWAPQGGRICLKGQSGIQTAFDTYRVRKPMRRAGPRGSDQWETISWDEAIDEIVNGHDGEYVSHEGLEEMWAYEDEGTVMADYERVTNGEMTQSAFDAKYEDVLIDTEIPELGPKANQIVDVGGFRRYFIRSRIFQSGLGTVNSHHHAGVCGFSSVLGNVRSYEGTKKRQYPDIENAEYVLVWGTNPMVSNKGPTWLAPKLTTALQNGLKMDVVDPRLSKTAEKADNWVPVEPGADGALAMGMARWIIEHDRYDEAYLRNPDSDAAAASDEPTFSDATHLVDVSDYESDTPHAKATAEDLGIEGSGKVVLDAKTATVKPASEVDRAALEVEISEAGVELKSVWSLYKERVFEHTIEEYAEMAGIEADQIADLADEFTSHGKKAAIMAYRGPAKHTNGFHNVRAIATLQHLIGNYDWKGGQITPYAGYETMSGRYELGAVPNGRSPWGLPITRAGANAEDFEGTRLFDEYPADRPWFRLSPQHQVQEIYPSAKDGYPYSINALFIRPYSENHVMATAGGDKIAEAMQDTEAMNLIVSFDTVIGETSKYADYILPEPTYLERWENFGTYPNKRLADEKISHPAVSVVPNARMAEDVLIDIASELDLPGVGEDAIVDSDGETWPLERAEDFYMKLVANLAYDTKTLDVDPSETNNLPPGVDPADFPIEDGPVPDADQREITVFRRAHENGLGEEFDYEAWKGAVKPAEWPKVVTVLNRGGRFEEPIPNYEAVFPEKGPDYDYAGRYDPSNAYVGEHMRYRLDSEVTFFNEIMPVGKDAYDGEPFDPLPKVTDAEHFNGDVLTPVTTDRDPAPDRPLHLINWKPRTQGMTRTQNTPWLRETRPTNPLWIHPDDAASRGIENGDSIVIDAGRGAVEAQAMVTKGIRPGVVGADWGWGRTANGAESTTIDGETDSGIGDIYGHTPYQFDEPMTEEAGYAQGRGAGFAINHLAPLDTTTEDVGPSDQIGGSNAQFDTRVEVRKSEQ